MDTSYSVQQIKFEFLSYIKEFGGNGSEWTIGLLNEAEQAKIASSDGSETADLIWICKPALSANAARLVAEYFVTRFGTQKADGFVASPDKNWVHMFIERNTAHP